ncbi:MAG: hypothetical protein ABIP65_03495 [Vicinamibacterales bacterium]
MAAWRLATVVFLVAALFNFPWELAQSPLYVAMPPLPARLWCCFVASLGDGVLLLLLWVAGWAVFRQKVWFGSPSAVRYVAMVVAGVGLGVVVEVAALEAGRWSYGPQMPRIGSVGVTPLLQMVLLPPLIFTLTARLVGLGKVVRPSQN